MKILKNRTVLGAVCIVAALVICFGITPLLNAGVKDTVEIVRVTKEVAAGEQIQENMLEKVKVGAYNLPEQVIKNTGTVVGKYAKADLIPGDYILATKLSETPAAENNYLYNLNGGKQAISISLKTFAKGVSGKLLSGDIVSVIAPDYQGLGVTVIPAELKYVEVIGVTTKDGADADGRQKPEDETELPSTVTLLATPEQCKLLAELEEQGKAHLAFVYRGNSDSAYKFIKAQADTLADLYPPKVQAGGK